MDRRDALKTMGLLGASTLLGDSAAAEERASDAEFFGVLVDTTRCAGCRNCEFVCAETNGLPDPPDDDSVLEQERKPSVTQWSVVNRYETDRGEVFVKRQCMHCNHPACASACLTKAMLKTGRGPVIWRESKCMGCRFCMISCPFDIPKFEYNSPVPKIQKCRMCWERLAEGEQPACVEECPEEALTFGPRRELLDIARRRIYKSPDRYLNHIYGEHETGGTGWLYLAAVSFEQLGFRADLGTEPYPELTKNFLYSVPVVFALMPLFLLGVSGATKRADESEGIPDEHHG
ncbi:MAG: 4Fe-4S dicluster domain-containing protein [Candidatus Krumholzibacteria bacterium]|nr:4Fe-4S dicluster domain-containing protein [Candidatus Krumholzibacteria bacterium]